MFTSSPSKRILIELQQYVYAFGNTPSQALLHPGVQDEVEVLLIGCGDIRNVLRTLADAPDHVRSISFHLNDIQPIIIARAVLLLHLAQELNPDDQRDVDLLWAVWNNAELSQEGSRSLAHHIEQLAKHLGQDFLVPSAEDVQSLHSIWDFWSSPGRWPSLKSVLAQRERHITETLKMKTAVHRTFAECVENQAFSYALQLTSVASDTEEHITRLRRELEEYLSTGSSYTSSSCRPGAGDAVANPTLLLPPHSQWVLHHSTSPFIQYGPISRDQLQQQGAQPGALTKACHGQLVAMLQGYRARLASGLKARFTFHIGDGLDLCGGGGRLADSQRFDIIDTSNVADHAGLLNVLVVVVPRLRPGGRSKLHTESMLWHTLADTVAAYLERALGMPPQMYPTVLGLRLLTDLEAGKPQVPNLALRLNATTSDSRRLVWVRVPQLGAPHPQPRPHLSLATGGETTVSLCSGIGQVIGELVKLCGCGPWADPKETAGLRLYSTMTLARVVVNLFQRVKVIDGSMDKNSTPELKLNHWLHDLKLLLPPELQLAWHTAVLRLQDAHQNQPSTSAECRDSASAAHMCLLIYRYQGLPFIQPPLISQPLITIHLLPPGQAPPDPVSSLLRGRQPVAAGVHVIDVVQCSLNGEDGTLDISFVLPADHGLPGGSTVVVVDQFTGNVVAPAQALSSYQESVSATPDVLLVDHDDTACHPTTDSPGHQDKGQYKKSSTESDSSCLSGSLQLHSFTEHVDKYDLELSVTGSTAPQGLTVHPHHRVPCCPTCHEVEIKLTRPEGSIRLATAWPLDVDKSKVKLVKATRTITAQLPKGDVWPADVQMQGFWVPLLDFDMLPSWRDDVHGSAGAMNGAMYTACQMAEHVRSGEVSPGDPKTDLLETIKTIIAVHVLHGETIFRIYDPAQGEGGDPAMYFRMHPPLRCLPDGRPGLLASVVDHVAADRLTKQGRLALNQALQDLKRIVIQGSGGKNMRSILCNASELVLLRRMLKRNSHAIVPSAWQRKHVPLGPDSPWYVSYVAPIFPDSAGDPQQLEAAMDQSDLQQGVLGSAPPRDSYHARQERRGPAGGSEGAAGSSTGRAPATISDATRGDKGEQRCAYCSLVSGDLKRCAVCKSVYYCGTECQRKHWRVHKVTCRAV